jgi:hypothetical protein
MTSGNGDYLFQRAAAENCSRFRRGSRDRQRENRNEYLDGLGYQRR